MTRNWTDERLAADWLLLPPEMELLHRRRGATRLGFALQLKFFQIEGRFAEASQSISPQAVTYVASQLGEDPAGWEAYPWDGRMAKYHRAEIRQWLGFREAAPQDIRDLEGWLMEEVLDREHRLDRLRETALERFRKLRVEPPTPERLKRHLRSALHAHETRFCEAIFAGLDRKTLECLDGLLQAKPGEEEGTEWTEWQALKADPGKAGLEGIRDAASRLNTIQGLGLPVDQIKTLPPKVLERYAKRAAVEESFELRRHPAPLRAALMACSLLRRNEDVTDALVDLLLETIHKMGKRAESKVEEELTGQLHKVPGKLGVLIRMAEASLASPKGVVNEVIYAVAPEKLLRSLLLELQSTGSAYHATVRKVIQRAYKSHYRRMLPELLGTLEFRCTNTRHQPVMRALETVKTHLDHKGPEYPDGVEVSLEGVVRPAWMPLVIEEGPGGKPRINRFAYEICVLKALREQVRCREIWVVGSRRFRDPEEDLPKDFEARRETYYAELGVPLDPKVFTASLREEMERVLRILDEGLPSNPKVKILPKKEGWIALSPFEPLPEPENLAFLKGEVSRRWPMTSLLDALKEADLRTGFTSLLRSGTEREHLDRRTLQRRLLLCLHGLGTNTGLKSMAMGLEDDYKDLLYVRRRFLSVDQLRQAIAQVVNATLTVRLPQIWGDATTACASDSKQFGSWDQNLLTEWHMRYGGRGVMVYWHVERKSTCIYSQLKKVSSSEAAAMIEGVLRHCTELEVERQYVDSHGQSEVAFAFCRLLGFELMPRLKAIHRQKLYRPGAGQPEAFLNLQPVLTRPINWELIEQQLDAMVKHTIALKQGTADAESILRRFTRANLQHPAYKALGELGKAIKTIFLCRYLASEELRREVNEGLNVVESWNAANGFIFYGKGGELATNRRENQEMGLLSLHLLQASLVYINTLMIQQVLAEPAWADRMTTRDLAALSPLITQHINPYGRFELDMDTRLPLTHPVETSA